MILRLTLLVAALLAATPSLRAEDGYRLWLRYAPLSDPKPEVREIYVPGESPTSGVIRKELQAALHSMLGVEVPVVQQPIKGGVIAVEVVKSLPEELGDEGYRIRAYNEPRRQIEVTARSDAGALYGTFHLLRLMQTGQPLDALDVTSEPRLQRRLLNHWDNLDGTIERGYAGNSLWKWDELPGKLDPRYTDYARANASIGINGVVLNNVNAKPEMLTAPYLAKVAALAGVFRPYGIRVYLSANFDAPRTLGKLPTADPLDAAVAAWWKAKADEIYKTIPDFGGFLVKANSEGQPGPQGYGRTHADGANLLADALAPHGGVVMWRAFVYEESVDPDRAKRAYIEFTQLDGKFRDNVIVQVKNGPVDFQPREPFHPLFGGMTRTPVMAELQIAPEYFAKHRHLVFFAPMWKEFLDADTHARGAGSTVAKVIDGSVHGHKLSGIAGVANTGSDRNWTAHDMSQANWYAFGRLAWDPDLSAQQIADEWIRMTWSQDAGVLDKLRPVMLSSWETFVRYCAPLGLTHLQADERDGPDPGSTALHRADWNPPYYHRAAKDGIGFDRTASGSDAVSQYFPPVRDGFANLQTCPDEFLLWFHHVPWDYKLRTGRSVWEELCGRYENGVERAKGLQKAWRSLEGKLDAERFAAVEKRLSLQVDDAGRWRDRALGYFQKVSGLPRPQQPAHDVDRADLPVPRFDDSTWVQKHDELIARAKKGDIDLYFAGDSITRRWEATHRENWDHNFAGYKAVSFGAGGDKTQNQLYRLENGELAGVAPKVVVLMIGTNNIGFEPPAGRDDELVDDVTRGVRACLQSIRRHAPNAKILLMGITPRNTNDTTALVPTINRINERLAKLADGETIRFCNINAELADKSGKLVEGMTEDGLHLSNKGYQVWADAIKPALINWLGKPDP